MPARRSSTPHSRPKYTRSLTTRGRCLFAGGIAAGICGIALNERDLVRIGVLAALLPLVALIIALARRPAIHAAFQRDASHYPRGTTGTITASLTYTGHTIAPVLRVTIPPLDGVTRGTSALVPSLTPHRTIQVRYHVTASRRGRFAAGPITITTADPLGLCSVSRTTTSNLEILVTPAVAPLTDVPPATGAENAASGTGDGAAGRGEPDVIVRPYHPGDDIRMIAWRASARSDETMVRTFESVSRDSATILLDHREQAHATAGLDGSLETAVTLTASIGQHLVNQGYDVHVTHHDATLLSHPERETDTLPLGLADIRPEDDGALSSDTRDSDLFVAVLGDIDPADAHLVDAETNHAIRRIALIVDATAWGGSQRPESRHAAALILERSGWDVVIVRSTDTIDAVWHAACHQSTTAGAQ